MYNAPVFAVADWITAWLTPIWILGVGCAIGLAVLLLIWGCLYAAGLGVPMFARGATAFRRSIFEGPMFPIFIVISILAAFAIVCVGVVDAPSAMLGSISRLPAVGTKTYQYKIEPAPLEDVLTRVPIKVRFDGNEIRRIGFSSDEDITVYSHKEPASYSLGASLRVPVDAGHEEVWNFTSEKANPFAKRRVSELFVINSGETAANLTIETETGAAYPQMSVVPITALGIVALFGFYFLHSLIAPKVTAVALATAKSEMNAPIFLLIAIGGCVALWAFIWIPYFTFGEDIKVLKDSGLRWILFSCIILAVWAASRSISEEIEGRTALTILSKPIGRRSFLLGKFMGIMWAIAVMFVILGVFFMLTISYKPIYDAKEASKGAADWVACHQETISVVPGLLLAFMEVFVLAAISVAISTRLPMLANFAILLNIFVLGHLTPLLVQTSEERFELVKFFSMFIATAFPVLEYFSVEAAIAGGEEVPAIYLATSFVYCLIYGGIALLVALIFFEDRDLT